MIRPLGFVCVAAAVVLSLSSVTTSVAFAEPASSATETASASPVEPVVTFAIDDVVGEIVKHFPRAEGKVVSADDKRVTLDIGAKDGLTPGIQVFLFRQNKPIRHPVTKVILGSREDALGSIVLDSVTETTAVGTIKELKVTRIISGDIARLSTERAKIAPVVIGKDYDTALYDKFIGLLRDSGRFIVSDAIESEKEIDEAATAQMIKEHSLDNIVSFSSNPTKNPDKTNAEIYLYSATGTLERFSGLVNTASDVYEEKVMEYNLVRGEHRDFYHSEDLAFRGKLLACGNLEGDGINRVVTSDGKKIVIYRIERGSFKEDWRFEGRTGAVNMFIDCADLDGNGTDEIYVTCIKDDSPESFVIEYNGTSYVKIADNIPMLLRVVDAPGKGRILITTTTGSDMGYSGIVKQYRWENGSLVSAGKFPIPFKIKGIYGFIYADIIPDKPGPEIVLVDDSDFIQILDLKGKRLWKSADRFGGYDNFFEIKRTNAGVNPSGETRGKVKGRLYVRTGPEGETQIILSKNIPMTNLIKRWKGYNGVELYGMAWEDGGLTPRWSIKNVEGYLADYFVGDISNTGHEDIAFLTDPTMKVQKKSKSLPMGSVESMFNVFADKSSLLIFKMPKR